MKETMKPVDFYMGELKGMGADFDEDGRVLDPLTKKVFQVEEKDVVLPTRAWLDKNDWGSVHPFHPLCEDALNGQSPSMHFLIKLFRRNFSIQLSTLIGQMLEIAYKPELQETLNNPKANKHLACLVGAKASTFTKWKTVHNKLKKTGLVSLHLARDVKKGDKKFLRYATLYSPIFEDRDSKESTIAGVSMTKADKKTIMDLIDYIFHGVPLEFGSNDTVPYYHAFCHMQGKLAKRINQIGKEFKKVTDFKPLDVSWVKQAEEMRDMVGIIPRLPGNEGVRDESTARREIAQDDEMYDSVSVPKKPEPKKEEPAPQQSCFDRGEPASSRFSQPEPKQQNTLSALFENVDRRRDSQTSDRFGNAPRFREEPSQDRRGSYLNMFSDGRDERRGERRRADLSDLGI